MFKNYQHLIVETKNNLLIVTLNRPDRLNALSESTLDELYDLLNGVVKNGTRAVLITGSGKAFCSGADVKDWSAKEEDKKKEGDSWTPKSHRIIKLIRMLPIPIIAAVNGVAVGAGCDLALACDIRIGSTNARFGEAYIRVGFNPDCGGTYFLPRIVGWGKAAEMIFTGEIINAEEAYRIGLLNRLVKPEELIESAIDFSLKLANGPTVAIGLAKHNLNSSWLLSLDEELEQELKAGAICAKTLDHKEALRAIVEKRKPKYIGK
jgi:enoyl-CoA hydratase/carnithine racemase